jgi:hypothetical protein
MRSTSRSIQLCMLLAVVVGCASTNITDRKVLVTEKLPRPGHVLVYDFKATPGGVPADSALAGQVSEQGPPQTAEQIAAGQKLGARIAAELVARIRAMGMPGERASAATKRQIDDIVIRGYLVSIQEGSAAERVTIGFGDGASELRTAVEGFQVTAQGLRKLGSGTLVSGGGKTPGAALGAATFIATANPAGLIVSSGMKAYGEASGDSTIQGRAEQTAKEIAEVLESRFRDQGWID